MDAFDSEPADPAEEGLSASADPTLPSEASPSPEEPLSSEKELSLPVAQADGAEAGSAAGPGEGEAESAEEMEEGPAPAPAFKPDPEKLLLCLLFASPEYLSYKTLKEVMGEEWDTPSLRHLLKQAGRRLKDWDLPFEVFETDGTFRLRTLPPYYPWVKKLFKDTSSRKLSQASLETLAIIAYKQPITKAEMEAIRGVNVDGTLKGLLEKKLIDIAGKSGELGGSYTYATTREFLKYFGINRVPDDLPLLSEFEELVQAKALLPQMEPGGEVREAEQDSPDSHQLGLDLETR